MSGLSRLDRYSLEMAGPAISNAQRDREILELWHRRPEHRRTGTDMVTFYRWLEQNRPDLLSPPGLGDPYQPVKALLAPHTLGHH
jgi:hypothetical protein